MCWLHALPESVRVGHVYLGLQGQFDEDSRMITDDNYLDTHRVQQGKARVLYLCTDLVAWLLRNRRDTQPEGENGT